VAGLTWRSYPAREMCEPQHPTRAGHFIGPLVAVYVCRGCDNLRLSSRWRCVGCSPGQDREGCSGVRDVSVRWLRAVAAQARATAPTRSLPATDASRSNSAIASVCRPSLVSRSPRTVTRDSRTISRVPACVHQRGQRLDVEEREPYPDCHDGEADDSPQVGEADTRLLRDPIGRSR
jgi:hypothetical protein